MAYVPTDWKNREVERPRTFTAVDNPDGTITLVPAEGTISEPGTPIIAVNMNKIEQGIADAVPKTEKGAANGVATLGPDGKVPISQSGTVPVPDASTTVKGIVKLNTSIVSSSFTEAATPSAVAAVNAKLNDTGWINIDPGNGWALKNGPNDFRYRIKNGVAHIVCNLYPYMDSPVEILNYQGIPTRPSTNYTCMCFLWRNGYFDPQALEVRTDGDIIYKGTQIPQRSQDLIFNLTFPVGI